MLLKSHVRLCIVTIIQGNLMTVHHKKRLVLGAHMSVAGNMALAYERAESIGCTTMQIFTKSNRQWYAKPIPEIEARLFIERGKQSTIHPVAVHASYLINIGAENPEIEQKSVESLTTEIARCEQLNIPYLVLHPGTAGTQTPDECIKRIARNLTKVLAQSPANTMICLENMAGHGSSVGHSFEQLAFIRNNVTPKERIGFCFDTCHAFAAGYDLRTATSYQAVWKEFDTHIGLTHLKVMHLNDSKKELGSNVDRHEDIGKGKLGLEAFRLILNDPHLFDIAKILETPNDTLEGYAENLAILKELLSPETKKILSLD